MASLLVLCMIPATTHADFKVLVYTEAYTLVHKSIPAGIQCVKELGTANGFTVDTASTATVMTPSNLSKYAVIVFMNTYGAIMSQSSQQQAFKGFINAGGGWVGVHGPTNCFTSWQWYGGLLGNNAWRSGQTFGKFPNVRESKNHFIVKDPPDTITLNDEYFGYQQNPRSAVTMLYSAKMGDNADHPSAWCHEYDGGRAVYGVWGQYDTTFADANYRKFLLKSIIWAAKLDVPVSVAKTTNQKTGRVSRPVTEKKVGDVCSRVKDGAWLVYNPLCIPAAVSGYDLAGRCAAFVSADNGKRREEWFMELDADISKKGVPV